MFTDHPRGNLRFRWTADLETDQTSLLSTRVFSLDHQCPWREEGEELRVKLYAVEAQQRIDVAEMRAELDALKRAVFGKKSEKMPPMSREAGSNPPRAPNKKTGEIVSWRRSRFAFRASALEQVGVEIGPCWDRPMLAAAHEPTVRRMGGWGRSRGLVALSFLGARR